MERENAITLSSEEKNELICSTKKVKDNHHDTTERTGVENWVASNAINPKLSFKDKLVGEIPGAFAQAFDLRDKEEIDKVLSSLEADMESDEIRELREGLVSAKISQGLNQRIRAPWSKALIMVRLNELPIEYYDSEALLIIGQAIGNVLRMNTHTATGTRGRYARLCIQVDFEKPLADAMLVNNFEQPITYEGLHRFCFSCGHIGHWREECIFTIRKPSPERPPAPKGTMKDNDAEVIRPCSSHEVDPKDDTYGPWMVVSCMKSSNRKDKKHDTAPTNAMHAVWREGVDVRTRPGDVAKVTPGVGVLVINEGKRKTNGDLVGLGEPLKEQSSFKGKGISPGSPKKLGLFNQGTSKAYEGPSSIKGKKVLARLRAALARSRGAEANEGNRLNKLLKTIWTPTNAASQADKNGKFQFFNKSKNSMGDTREGKDSDSSNNNGVAQF
ncbi:hypothetical protein SO802_007019 [Lithocarpus litseifolius]|uniref:CCHC-type domain-containing protein n=1 Tax=Lithocarpus litseifolius TaxID=425828 RepID=A0AAW2DSH3_9ROSI